MMSERFAVGQPRRAAIARVIEERPEIAERADMRAVAFDDLDVGIAASLLRPSMSSVQAREKSSEVSSGARLRRSSISVRSFGSPNAGSTSVNTPRGPHDSFRE